MDRFHRRLRQIAFFDNPEDVIADPPTQPQGNTSHLTDDNLHSFEPFKHRNFKTKSNWNPPGPHNLESMITCNEQQFNARDVRPVDRRDNLNKGERKVVLR
jgi:hypothetical protein